MLEAAQRATGLKPNEARSLLGRFLFSGEAAEKPLDGLSGGERRRLSLAILVHSGANVLVLDEPTNHLDLESREALEAALQAFPGSLLLISHDRALLDAVGTRTVARRGADAALVRRRLARVPARARGAQGGRAHAPSAPSRRSAARRPGRPPARRRTSSAARGELEKAIEAAEAELAALEDELADPSAWNDPRTAAKSTRRHDEAKQALQALYEEWETVAPASAGRSPRA